MVLVIHDLNQEQWEQIAPDYPGSFVISDNGSICPCVGCFGCWNKTPGQCVIRDGYGDMGRRLHEADEVVVISRYTFGGFSGFVKNVFDRSLGYVLPHFEIVNGESHHKKRYDEDMPYTFIFYGKDLTEGDKEKAERYVRAVCTNIRGHVKDVQFLNSDYKIVSQVNGVPDMPGKIALINASMRGKYSNSAKLASLLTSRLTMRAETFYLSGYLHHMSDLVLSLRDYSTLVLCTPLYVDGLPSQMIRFMDSFLKDYNGSQKRVYLLANMGLYESEQLVNLFSAVRMWTMEMNFDYCGGLGIGAGELVGGLMEIIPFGTWPLGSIAEGLVLLNEAIGNGTVMEDRYTGPVGFPRALYIAIANSGWKRMARKNGIRNKDLFRKL